VVGAPNEGDPNFGARVRFPLVEDGVRADGDAGHGCRCGRELLGVIVEVWRGFPMIFGASFFESGYPGFEWPNVGVETLNQLGVP
jgi:hypothetical protein